VEANALRARCEAVLADVYIPQPFDLGEFADHIGKRRGRPILLLPIAMSPQSPSGMWIHGERCDAIAYEQATTPLHQNHIALHEIGHLLCGHQAGDDLDGRHLRRLFPSLDAALVHRMLARTSYSTDEEQEAEMLASLILQRSGPPSAVPAPPPSPAATQILRRLESSL
jgi:hypothetical protein